LSRLFVSTTTRNNNGLLLLLLLLLLLPWPFWLSSGHRAEYKQHSSLTNELRVHPSFFGYASAASSWTVACRNYLLKKDLREHNR
jgi:hypothetical protein